MADLDSWVEIAELLQLVGCDLNSVHWEGQKTFTKIPGRPLPFPKLSKMAGTVPKHLQKEGTFHGVMAGLGLELGVGMREEVLNALQMNVVNGRLVIWGDGVEGV